MGQRVQVGQAAAGDEVHRRMRSRKYLGAKPEENR